MRNEYTDDGLSYPHVKHVNHKMKLNEIEVRPTFRILHVILKSKSYYMNLNKIRYPSTAGSSK